MEGDVGAALASQTGDESLRHVLDLGGVTEGFVVGTATETLN